jgi:glycerol-3-phosphate dehydrogenase (NAD(P)+)
MSVAVIGAGAFGTALAIALAPGRAELGLWARDAALAEAMEAGRENTRRLPGARLPDPVRVSSRIGDFAGAETVMIAVPMQEMAAFLAAHGEELDGRALVACAKGIDLDTGLGPTALIARACPSAVPAILTGPSFAADIARGLPTALTLACRDEAAGERLQHALAAQAIRLYRTDDVVGAELGGALKNVIAIAAGAAIGAGLGDSARAAVVTRGFAEMVRLATALGARGETLMGLSGFGDLILTATSPQSRNFRFGLSLGAGQAFDPGVTVEGIATARAATALSARHGIEVPLTATVAALVDGRLTLAEAVAALLARPLRKE